MLKNGSKCGAKSNIHRQSLEYNEIIIPTYHSFLTIQVITEAGTQKLNDILGISGIRTILQTTILGQHQ